jgi:DNA-binding response OmpR family regulator
MKERLLLVEDDALLVRMLRDNLVYEGFEVLCAQNGAEAIRMARDTLPDLVLLDLMIPAPDGFEVCRVLSSERHRLPIIILTARSQRDDKVRGLELGADDYVTKPFALEELLARIHAVLRRTRRHVQTLALGDTIVDFERMQAVRSGVPLALTPREFALLQYLAEHAGRAVTRDELLRTVWGYESNLSRTVDSFVARLRRKIEVDPHHPRFIRTMHGDGYGLTLTVDA